MTLKKVMEMALRRAGLNEETSSFLDNARDYFNVGLRDLSERRAWRWLFKSSTFTTTSSTRNYSLASDVMRPLSFVNTTDNHTMDIVDASVVDRVDPDADEEGNPRSVYIAGINSSTGYWTVDLYPIPDDGSTTITYRYYAFIADKTSSNDDTDLAATLPPWAQNAMIYFISSQYKGELGDLDGEQTDYLLYERAIANNLKVDAEAESGNTPDRMARHGEIFVRQSFNFNVNEGSLST
jgi:hypothetical protein